jgi:hypothetical protein
VTRSTKPWTAGASASRSSMRSVEACQRC